MRILVALFVVVASCEPPAKAPQDSATATSAPAHVDPCRDDIPDCAAACALRETSRRDFVDFYDRRCAAVILGKNPDRVADVTPHAVVANASASAPPASSAFPPDVRASLMMTRSPFDPANVTRTGAGEPPECKAARALRAHGREREADMLDALCMAKGGDAGT